MLPPRHQKAAKRAFWAYWPRRLIGERGLVAVLLGLAMILMFASVVAPDMANTARLALYDKTRVVFAALSAPAQKIAEIGEHMSGLSDTASDLEALRAENARLKQWYDRALQLEAENRSLRALVNLADLPRISYVTARVIASSGNGFAQSLIVDAGADKQVREDSVAMTGDGVIGRVVGVQGHTAQIVLLTDVNARVPVVIENSRHRGVLAGNNSNAPQLLYLPDDAAIASGERVLTSGQGGVFVPGLPVGMIASVRAGDIRVKPFADLHRLDVVQLIHFDRAPMMQDATSHSVPASK